MFHVDNYIILWYIIYRYEIQVSRNNISYASEEKAVGDRRAKGKEENGKRNIKGKYKL